MEMVLRVLIIRNQQMENTDGSNLNYFNLGFRCCFPDKGTIICRRLYKKPLIYIDYILPGTTGFTGFTANAGLVEQV
jgi:hypothetical protein